MVVNMAFWNKIKKKKDSDLPSDLFRPKEYKSENIGITIKSDKVSPLTPSYVPSSGFNSDLLRDAIADAKAVRATALANAKSALNAAFGRQIEDDIKNALSPKEKPIILPDSCSNLPGYKIEFKDSFKGPIERDFNDSIDFTSAISGPIATISLSASYKMQLVDSHGNPSPSNPANWSNYAITSSYVLPNAPKAPYAVSASYLPSGAGLEAKMGFNVVIGNSKWSNQLNSITNSRGGKIYFANNLDSIRRGLDKFVNKMMYQHDGNLPTFRIDLSAGCNVDLMFKGFKFGGANYAANENIQAIFGYGGKHTGVVNMAPAHVVVGQQDELVRVMNEVRSRCLFFIMGEFELDEHQDRIVEMEIEYFGYSYQADNSVNKKLLSV